jgi:hypothetical protein
MPDSDAFRGIVIAMDDTSLVVATSGRTATVA